MSQFEKTPTASAPSLGPLLCDGSQTWPIPASSPWEPTEARCDKCGEPPFWPFPRLGDPCPCGGKLIAVKLK